MTPAELRKAAHYLEAIRADTETVLKLRRDAHMLERDALETQQMRGALERMDAPVTVRAGDIAAALHWIEDHAWLSDTPVPNAVLELQLQLANVHVELIGELA